MAGGFQITLGLCMRQGLSAAIGCFFTCLIFSPMLGAQRVLSEARINYTVTAEPIEPETKVTDAFKNASQTIWMRGNMVRVDFESPLRQQSVIYNGTNHSAIMLRESGEDKYQWNLDSLQWRNVNKQWENAEYSNTDETCEISGYLCKKLLAKLVDGTLVTLFFTTQLMPLVKGYDILAEPLEGLPVQWEWQENGLRIRFTMESVQIIPVGVSRFDVPKSGYKQLEFLEKKNNKQ